MTEISSVSIISDCAICRSSCWNRCSCWIWRSAPLAGRRTVVCRMPSLLRPLVHVVPSAGEHWAQLTLPVNQGPQHRPPPPWAPASLRPHLSVPAPSAPCFPISVLQFPSEAVNTLPEGLGTVFVGLHSSLAAVSYCSEVHLRTPSFCHEQFEQLHDFSSSASIFSPPWINDRGAASSLAVMLVTWLNQGWWSLLGITVSALGGSVLVRTARPPF